ncbi:helix-turn-helix domain-containing protein [Cohnella suwonensis]|uniref:Helix-turn-helix domain-containing protein n=1 Tax=Cohnella suwonensis TaxID=696072 RepID=A0ABW0LVT2_9BACL
MNAPELLRHGGYTEPLYVEYVKRSYPFDMAGNHFHPFYEIYYLLSGSRTYFIKDTAFQVEPGDLVFIDKNVIHRTLQSGPPEHERIVVHIDDRFVAERLRDHADFLLSPFGGPSPVLKPVPAIREAAGRLMERIITELSGKQTGFDLLLRQAVPELLALAARCLESSENPIVPDTASDNPTRRKISEVARYLNESFREPVRVPDLAERFFISPYYLSRLFKEVTGFALIDYVNLTRVKESQRLLRESDLSVTEIAERSGFDNFSHFGKTFKKITRATARDYRKELRASSRL